MLNLRFKPSSTDEPGWWFETEVWELPTTGQHVFGKFYVITTTYYGNSKNYKLPMEDNFKILIGEQNKTGSPKKRSRSEKRQTKSRIQLVSDLLKMAKDAPKEKKMAKDAPKGKKKQRLQRITHRLQECCRLQL